MFKIKTNGKSRERERVDRALKSSSSKNKTSFGFDSHGRIRSALFACFVFLMVLGSFLFFGVGKASATAAPCSSSGGNASGICYVDTNSSGGDGTTQATSGAHAAFATIATVNGYTYTGDDQILFKKGDTWREQLTVPSSGTSGHPITFGAYGSGANPIISGSNIFTSWTDNSTGSYTFNDGFESGDTTAWTSKTDTGSKLSVQGTTKIDGNYSMKVTNSNTTPSYVTKTFTQLNGTAWYTEFKINFDSNFTVGAGSGTRLQVAEIDNSSWGMIFEIYVINTGGSTMKWEIVRNQPSYTTVTTSSTITPGSAYTVRVSSTGIGGTSGTYEMDVNSTPVYTIGSLALNGTQSLYEPDQLQIGTYYSSAAAPAGNLYFDDAWANPTVPTGVYFPHFFRHQPC